MSKLVPDWIAVIVGAMYRFTVGAFGVSLPHPLRTTLCKPFWTAMLGCTLGLPIVLLIWAIRLIFEKKNRSERPLNDTTNLQIRSPISKFFEKLFYAVIIIYCVGIGFFIIGCMIYAYGWLVAGLVILSVLGIAALTFILTFKICELGKKITRQNLARPEQSTNHSFATKKIFSAIIWLPKMIAVGIWQMLAFFGLMTVATYKKFCPIVEFP